MTRPEARVIFPSMREQGVTGQKTIENRCQRAEKELKLFYEISNQMRATLELNHILHIILTAVTSHIGLGFNRAFLFLVNNHERSIEGKMFIGPQSGEEAQQIWTTLDQEEETLEKLSAAYRMAENINNPFNRAVRRFRIPLHPEQGGLLAQAACEQNPLHLEKDDLKRFSNDPLLSLLQTQEIVIVPLRAKDKIVGLIVADNCYSHNAITPEDLHFFSMLANQAGLAIENSQLYEMVVHKSHTDSLTNLWNHGYFQDTLGQKIHLCDQTDKPLSLAMIDVDNFKTLNDSCGHQNGDIILQNIAAILKESSRDQDVVCRYGGEEFSCILFDTTKDQAYLITERLRESIETFDFPKLTSESDIKITVSIGIAEYPKDAFNKEDLVMKADQAMYTAKFLGKNRTTVHPNP